MLVIDIDMALRGLPFLDEESAESVVGILGAEVEVVATGRGWDMPISSRNAQFDDDDGSLADSVGKADVDTLRGFILGVVFPAGSVLSAV